MSQSRNHAAKCDLAVSQIKGISSGCLVGHVLAVAGHSVDVAGLGAHIALGHRTVIIPATGRPVSAEVVGFRSGLAQTMAFGSTDGLGYRADVRATLEYRAASLMVCESWLGRVIDPLGNPLDGLGPLQLGKRPQPLRTKPPEATQRAKIGGQLDVGVCALNIFTPCRVGQRLGLFAGSGVGKSTLLGMLAKNSECDICVFAMIGERGREVREFIENELGETILRRSVIVVATSDASPILRREAAYAAMSVAEYFRDSGNAVALFMDSITRVCNSLREIGLAAGEPPAIRGYPPSVFSELPRLLERAGPGDDRRRPCGSITGFFSVLVDGDDQNEPVSDAIRGLLDGHIILDRRVAERGRFPAVDILRSISRMNHVENKSTKSEIARRARTLISIYSEMEDFIRLGAYKPGVDKTFDEAFELAPRIEIAMRQLSNERVSIAESFARLTAILNVE